MQKLKARNPQMPASVKPCNIDNWGKNATANPDITWYK
jgi:hypothetical protein